MAQDRIYIDKARAKEIREIKDAGYLSFDNQKDVFMLALALGGNTRIGGVIEGSREGLFNDRDLYAVDKAMIYSIVNPELGGIENIVNRDLVLKKAEDIANKGFTILLNDMKDKGVEAYLMIMLNKANELFEEAKEDGLFLD